jgi:hypothetical protein
MGTKLISDIRLFELNVPNIDGNPTPHYIGKIYQYDHMECLAVIQRLLFLLRHRGFEFDDFDHLYLNFTPCVTHGEVHDVNRYNIREFSWYHYVDIGCNIQTFNDLSLKEKNLFILESVRKASLLKARAEQQELFEATFYEVIQNGERFLLPYKQKDYQNYIVEIFTRITDKASFIPLIRVTDKNGVVIAEQELRSYGRDEFIYQMGTITIGKASARIVPRKSSYGNYYDLTPIKIEW